MSHASARLAPTGGLLMVQRVDEGMPRADVARQMRMLWGRPQSGGTVIWQVVRSRWHAGLRGRIGRRAAPRQGSRSTFAGCGAAPGTQMCLSVPAGVPAATVRRILARNGSNRL